MPAHEFICSVLRGDGEKYPTPSDAAFEGELLSLAEVHGVLALLHQKASAENTLASWSPKARERLVLARNIQAARELLVKRELASLLRRFADAEVDVLLIKGAPLAYLLYAEPYLRTRGDADLLIASAQRQLAHETLLAAGYGMSQRYERKLASYQCSYSRRDRAGLLHVVDLHWRLSNRQGLARLLGFEELRDSAEPVPELSANARTPDTVHALMIACLHRAAHITGGYFVNGIRYSEANRLIWLYDIHLLVLRMSDLQWSTFVELAETKKARAICLDALRIAETCLRTPNPAWVMDRLAAPGPRELSAGHLKPQIWRRYLSDLRSLPNWRQRFVLLNEWAFPPAEHLMKKYGVRHRCLLPALYLRRSAGGLRRIIGRKKR